MSTQHCTSEGCTQSSTGRETQIARKLDFQDENSNDSISTSPKESSPLTWRTVKQEFEYSEHRETQTLYSYMASQSSPVARFEFSDPDQVSISDCEDSQDKIDYTSSETSDNLGQDQELVLLDEEDHVVCRKSAATTDITGSHHPPTPNKELSQNLLTLADVMVNLNLTQYLGTTFVKNAETSFVDSSETTSAKRIKFKQNCSKSETVTNSYPGPKIKFRSPSNSDQCEASMSTLRKESTSCTRSFQPSDLAPISLMLKTCQEIHPFDLEPKEPRPTPIQSPIKSLMDGGDAVDVRGLANRLSRMKSESRMKDALKQYMHTHIPSMQGRVDQIIETTVQQIAAVSLKDKVPPRKDISAITATSDWLKIQNGSRELRYHGNGPDQMVSSIDDNLCQANIDSRNSLNGPAVGIVELDSENIRHHRIESGRDSLLLSRNVAEVCCSRGNLIHSEYISPEEYRFASYTDRKGKRKIHEVYGDSEPSPERFRRKGKKKVAFALDEEDSKPEVIRFQNGSWN